MHELDYAELYLLLKKEAESQGLHIKLVGNSVLHDYAGMNPEAAKAMGKSQPANEIEIEAGVSYIKKYSELNHELIERNLMTKGWHYWPAHVYALEHERDISTHLLSQIEHRNVWAKSSSSKKAQPVHSHIIIAKVTKIK